MSTKLKLWLLALTAMAIFVVIFGFFLTKSEQAFLDQARRDLSASVQEKAQLLGAWRANLSTTLIALAEQREIREGVAKIASDQASSAWRDGFTAACDASIRAIQISNPAFENLSVRALDGAKIAGSGAAVQEVIYPDLRLRIHQLPLSPLKEKWIVPIRDPQAIPLAYIVSDVNIQQSKRALGIGAPPAEYLLCLDDTSGHRIWDSDDARRIPQVGPSVNEFVGDSSRIFMLKSVPIPGTSWKLSIARERSLVFADSLRARKFLIFCASGAMIFLILFTLALSRRL